jgi:hypothetical protein
MSPGLPAKPRINEPCNGCGICCIVDPCAVAYEFISTTVANKPCPALELEDGRYWCGMVRHPSRHMDRPESIVDECKRLGPEATARVDHVIGRHVAEILGGVGGTCDGGDLDDPEGSGDPFLGLTADVVARAVFACGGPEKPPDKPPS